MEYELYWKAGKHDAMDRKYFIDMESYLGEARRTAYKKIRLSQKMTKELGISIKNVKHIEIYGIPWDEEMPIQKLGEAYPYPKDPEVVLWLAPNNTIHILNKDGSLKALKKSNVKYTAKYRK